ncbi:mechanosensitive ion channel family protein [Parasulfuritortus cantonensis]|uniref:Small-conductance mechanosensitive channel n=1 Tax=Parasulfuritortus cantonensis TaxID=2528202 RepID=A0A4R1B3Y6_9PROT|nr:mechanosensitive ion channel family protein [Parasulfuritortus cantonensis]TCJ12792.1 mechanosensitive ion channel family protein [Parasulfuritortus cantonensis]
MNNQLAALEQAQSTAIDLAIKFGPKLLVACVVMLVGYFVALWVARVTAGVLTRLELDITVRTLLVRVARLLVLLLFVIMALQNLGVELLPLVAGLGVAGAGAALAMQGVLSNLAAGLTIIFTRPFRVGEFISIAGEEGQVEVISLFNTVLSHADRSRVVIPNRKIAGEILHNYGQVRQANVSVGVAYDSDLDQALAVVHDILANQAMVLREPAPLVQVAELADSSVNISVKPWVPVDDFPGAAGSLNKAILEAFRARGIAIPFPQREVHLLGRGDAG